MHLHPLLSSRGKLLAGFLFYLSIMAALVGLLVLYGGLPIVAAIVDATVFIAALAAGSMATFFFFAALRVWQAHTAASLIIILLCLCVCFAVVALAELEDAETFLYTLPLRALTGASGWTIFMLLYRTHIYADERQANEEAHAPVPAPVLLPQSEYLDRISVKDSGRIHIVPVKELLYIQASGDYVALFTSTGQFIKEQTMKYFDLHLSPAVFVRIHRSTIVNTEHILRVELFGKDTYNVRLKNGANLRASITGYRLLKERLNL